MECSFCKKTYSNVYTLKNHQLLTRACIILQKEQGKIVEDKGFECYFCKKILSSKARLEYHYMCCKIKIKQDARKEFDQALEQTAQKIIIEKEDELEEVTFTFSNENEELKHELKLKDEKLKEKDIKIQELQERIKEFKENHKSKKFQIPKAIKTMVWNKYIGSTIAETLCLCCKQEKINIRHFQCGHVISEACGGTTSLENLRPICYPCNMSMGKRDMREFIRTFFERDL